MLHVCFSMMFSGVKCPFPGKIAKGRVTPVLHEYLFRDYIYVRCDSGYKLMMVRWHLSKSKSQHQKSAWLSWQILSWYFTSYRLFSVRTGKSWRVSPPCAKAMESGTSLSQNATVRTCTFKLPQKLFNVSTFQPQLCLDHSSCHCCDTLFLSPAVIDCGNPKPLLNGGITFLSGFQNQYRSVVQYHCNEPFYSILGDKNGEMFSVLTLVQAM